MGISSQERQHAVAKIPASGSDVEMKQQPAISELSPRKPSDVSLKVLHCIVMVLAL